MNTVHDKLKKIKDNDIIIRPDIKGHKFAVEILDKRCIIYKRKRTVGEYKHTTKTINKALKEAVEFVYSRLVS